MGRSDRLVVEATPHMRMPQPTRVPSSRWMITVLIIWRMIALGSEVCAERGSLGACAFIRGPSRTAGGGEGGRFPSGNV